MTSFGRCFFFGFVPISVLCWHGINYASCHAARSTLVMLVTNNVHKLRWPAKSLDLNPIDHLLDLLKGKVRAQPLQLKFRELTRVIYHMWAAIPQQYIHRHILSKNTRYLAVDATSGGCTKYWNKIKYDVICFCFKSVPVNSLIKDRSSYQILFYMLGIICIKLVSGYYCFSLNTFPRM